MITTDEIEFIENEIIESEKLYPKNKTISIVRKMIRILENGQQKLTREQIAMEFLKNYQISGVFEKDIIDYNHASEKTFEVALAEYCYKIADAMISERDKK